MEFFGIVILVVAGLLFIWFGQAVNETVTVISAAWNMPMGMTSLMLVLGLALAVWIMVIVARATRKTNR